MSDTDFLKLLNVVVKLAKPFHDQAPPIDNVKDSLSDHGIDSLDMLMIGMYACDVFGISEEDAKQMRVRTVEELRDFLYAHATKKDIDVDAAIESLK